jgi:hypothetical protein
MELLRKERQEFDDRRAALWSLPSHLSGGAQLRREQAHAREDAPPLPRQHRPLLSLLFPQTRDAGEGGSRAGALEDGRAIRDAADPAPADNDGGLSTPARPREDGGRAGGQNTRGHHQRGSGHRDQHPCLHLAVIQASQGPNGRCRPTTSFFTRKRCERCVKANIKTTTELYLVGVLLSILVRTRVLVLEYEKITSKATRTPVREQERGGPDGG